MKRLILFLIGLTIISFTDLSSQTTRNNRINSERIAFFTRRLELSSDEAEKFWPVYNDYTSRKEKLSLDRNSLLRYLSQNHSNLSEDELKSSIDKYIGFSQLDADLSKEYHVKFMEILGPSKVIKLYNTEVQFKTLLLKQLQNQRDQGNLRRRRLNM